MIPDHGKLLEEANSYRQIILLQIMNKIFENPTLKRLRVILEVNQILPTISLEFGRNTLPQNKYIELQRLYEELKHFVKDSCSILISVYSCVLFTVIVGISILFLVAWE
jgi:hypothetical protein